MNRLLICSTVFAGLIAFSSPAQAVLTLRVAGNGVTATIVDDGAGDTDGAAGSILVDALTLAGWNAGQGGDAFTIRANTTGSNAGNGVINVQVDYDWSNGAAVVPIQVAASELFIAGGGPLEFATHSLNVTETASTGLQTVINASEGHFSTSLPNPGPLDPFDFAAPGNYENTLGFTPPNIPAAPGLGVATSFDQTLVSTGPFTVGGVTAPGLSLGSRLRVANNLQITPGVNAVGTVTTSTIVNPEPVSLLLSSFGASAFGLGYLRRRKSVAKTAA